MILDYDRPHGGRRRADLSDWSWSRQALANPRVRNNLRRLYMALREDRGLSRQDARYAVQCAFVILDETR